MLYGVSYDYIFFHFVNLILFLNLCTKYRAIAVKIANNSSACPEFPKKLWTKANIIQTTNQMRTNIINL